MQYREDHRSGKRLSVLGFGCMRFPGSFGRIDMEKTEKLILRAYEGGVNYFDTAYLYPGSEEALGEILARNDLRTKVHIATKLPHASCNSIADVDRYFDTQLKRLKTDYIDYYLIHNVTSLAQWKRLEALGIRDWIAQKKALGAIRQIGFSYHGQRDEFPATLAAYDWDFTQIQYNYINTNYQAGMKGLKLAAEKGLPVIVMEPLLGGKLATGLPKEAADIFAKAKPGSTPAEWALRWVWNQGEVTVLLSGMNDPAQLEENLRLADAAVPGMFGAAELETFDRVVAVFNRSYKVPCTGCNYCMPCPQKIDIPGSFSAYNASFAIARQTGIFQYITSSNALGAEPHLVSGCIGCGKCESHCPQGIKIRDELKNVKRRLQFPGLMPMLAIVRKFMR
jgi:predicted aldo/keto reductase-like oxidoreductase